MQASYAPDTLGCAMQIARLSADEVAGRNIGRELLGFASDALRHAMRIAFHVIAPKPLSPKDLAYAFAALDELLRRANEYGHQLETWPTNPGTRLGSWSGNSALEAALRFATNVRNETQHALGWSMTWGLFPAHVMSARADGDPPDPLLAGWPDKVKRCLQPLLPPWQPRELHAESDLIATLLQDEYRRFRAGPQAAAGETYVDQRIRRVKWDPRRDGYISLSQALSLLRDATVRFDCDVPSLKTLGDRLETPGNPVRHMKRKDTGGGRGNRRVLASDVTVHARYLLGAEKGVDPADEIPDET